MERIGTVDLTQLKGLGMVDISPTKNDKGDEIRDMLMLRVSVPLLRILNLSAGRLLPDELFSTQRDYHGGAFELAQVCSFVCNYNALCLIEVDAKPITLRNLRPGALLQVPARYKDKGVFDRVLTRSKDLLRFDRSTRCLPSGSGVRKLQAMLTPEGEEAIDAFVQIVDEGAVHTVVFQSKGQVIKPGQQSKAHKSTETRLAEMQAKIPTALVYELATTRDLPKRMMAASETVDGGHHKLVMKKIKRPAMVVYRTTMVLSVGEVIAGIFRHSTKLKKVEKLEGEEIEESEEESEDDSFV